MTHEEEVLLKIKLKPKNEKCLYCLKGFEPEEDFKILNGKTVLHNSCFINYKTRTYILNRFILWICILIFLVTCIGVYEFTK